MSNREKSKARGNDSFTHVATKKGPVPTFKNVKPENVNPLTEQFAPSDACPIRQRAQMGGVQ